MSIKISPVYQESNNYKPHIKMLATDIDGTLLNDESKCSKRTKDVISEIQDKGVKVILASGRMYDGVFAVKKEFNLKSPVICYQGAMIRDDNEILWHKKMDKEITLDLIKTLRERNIHTHVYDDDILYVEDDDKKIMADYCNNRYMTYKVVDKFEDLELNNVSKVLVAIYDEDEFIKLQNDMMKKYEGRLKIVRSNKYYLEFNNIDATKGNALEFLKAYYGIKTNEVMAIGDQDNDVELLENAGVKVAMGNGTPKLKEAANYITKDVDDDGLYFAVKKFILGENDL